jgi:hypothetical protein
MCTLITLPNDFSTESKLETERKKHRNADIDTDRQKGDRLERKRDIETLYKHRERDRHNGRHFLFATHNFF